MRLPPQSGEWIDRSKPLDFRFEGRDYTGFEGDTVASALWAGGVTRARPFASNTTVRAASCPPPTTTSTR